MNEQYVIRFIKKSLEDESNAMYLYTNFLKRIEGDKRYRGIYKVINQIFEDETKHYLKLQNMLVYEGVI